jgi:hypothetical protein
MAVFLAEKARMVAIEVKGRSLNLYTQLAPILSTVNAWTLNGLDAALPLPFDIRVALESYMSMRLQRLQLESEIESLLTAQVGDTLAGSVAPPPSGSTGLMDGSATFDGSGTFGG